MDRITPEMLVLIPLSLATVLYVLQAFGYGWFAGRPGMALCFIGYATANIGLIWDAIQIGFLN